MVNTSSPTGTPGAALAMLGSLTGAALVRALYSRSPTTKASSSMKTLAPDPAKTNLAARRLNRAAGTLAISVLCDSALEHYRGDFRNKMMYTPLVTAAMALCVSAHGTMDQRQTPHVIRDTVYVLTAIVGLIGTGFHLFNVRKRVGSISWQNLFYGAPVGAPMAIGLSGLLGYLSERVRETPPGQVPMMWGLPAGRVVGVVSGLGMVGTTGEAGLLHFRGGFHDPFMYLPVTMPPVTALVLGRTALGPAGTERRATRWWLRATAILGLSGSAFHAIGVGRDMGGWRNWQQNILNGPPIPAPPAFTGLALAGLAALSLLEDHPDD
ncbi:hypothetical protein [Acetobacter senegalensis]|uniref:hypothetical protein n=1 Tax=Acetobacter senegalensis TaxID=446692 RepID=UPI001EDC1C25|nr:hypothetical protein [Acetobacter senegalensis]MCG4255299.1 hypothetical protein [Acetobacter senegalensis]MCG4274571.1 hypothetical protein [Acetobacter senegalensis]